MRPILAVDPGLTTGWATHYPARSVPSVEVGQVEGVVEYMRWARSFLGSSPVRGVLVCENFVPRGQQAALSWQPASLHLIGFLMGEADYRGWEFRLQSPADAKRFATNDKLKRAGWWVPGQDHARDALRHLMVYLCMVERDAELLKAVAP